MEEQREELGSRGWPGAALASPASCHLTSALCLPTAYGEEPCKDHCLTHALG